MLANPDFRRFWLSSVLSNFGAQVTMLALPICAVLLILRLLAPAVLRLHGAACAVRHARAGHVAGGDGASAPLGALAAGALAERFSVRTALACVAAGALALAVATVFGTRLRAVKD
jgi:hypothetical protein